jgi:hypothetical protein
MMRMLLLAGFVATLISGQEKAVAQRPHYGGFGGTHHGTKQCPDHVIGLHGYVGTGGEGGTVVTQLGFTCANGEHELGTFGPPQGTYFQIDCNAGDAANGVSGRSGKYLDAIGLWCRDAKGNSYAAPAKVGPFFGVAGGGGGTPFNMWCGQQGEITLAGLDVWSGASIDGFEPVCNPVSGQGSAVAQRPHFGGYGGTEHHPKQCPDHVVGIHGYAGAGGEGGTVVTQLGFTCANGEHELGTFGPPQGTYFQIDCNAGDAANGVSGRSGKYLDAIGLWCRDPRGNSYAAPVKVGVAGGGGGNPFKKLCGQQGEIPLIGLNVWSGANIDGFEPLCNRTTVTMPMDLVWDQLDDNGLPLNPQWQYQVTRRQPGLDPAAYSPDVPRLCDVYDPKLAGCTSQDVTSNTQPNTWINAGCNWPTVSSVFTSGLFAGHKNWFPATVVGPVVLDAGYDDSWASQNSIAQGAIGWDADMDFYVHPKDGNGLTLSSVVDKLGQIGPEWDGYEVFFDDSLNPDSWWNRLFKSRNTRNDPDNTAKNMVNPPPAIAGPGARDNSVVIGMFGLDCRHYCHAELHPTYAMAIHTQAFRTDDRWAVFARNWGNEGSCGSLQEEVLMQSFSMRLGHPYATAVQLNSNYWVGRSGRYDQGTTILSPPTVGWNLPLTVVNPGTRDAATILTIALPPASARAVVLGEVALTWTESPHAAQSPATQETFKPAQSTTSSRDDEHIEALIERMTPAQRTVFLANAPKPKPPVPQRAVAIPQNPHLAPVKVQDFKKIVRSTPDPARAQHFRQFNQAMCSAYEGKLPGLPGACGTLGPASVLNLGLISVEPSPLEFTPLSGGAKAVTITNISSVHINLGAPSVGGANAPDFAIDTGCLHASLAPGAACKIGVRFGPRGVGQRTAELNIPFADGSRGALVEMTGPGLIP